MKVIFIVICLKVSVEKDYEAVSELRFRIQFHFIQKSH